MNLTRILVVMRKELMDGSRDRRAVYTIVFGSLFGPLLIWFLLNQLAGEGRSALEMQVPVVGQQYAPALVNWLDQQPGIQVVTGPADAEGAVRDRKQEFVLVIDKEFAKKFRESRPAPVQLMNDSTRQSARQKVRRVQGLLRQYGAEIGGLRLMARGVSPSIANPLKVEDVEVSNSQQRAAAIFNFIPMFLILSAFTAAMQIATDSTAGERERGSLEPLLLNPLPRWQLVVGKWLAAATASLAGMGLSLLVIRQVLAQVKVEDLGFRFQFGTVEALLVLAAVIPMALVAPAVQLYLSCFARTFKEAQSYMGFLIVLPTLPGLVSSFYPLTGRPWMTAVPILGQYAMAADILSGTVPPAASFVLSAAVNLAAAAVFLVLTTRLLGRERIIFGR